MPSNRTLAKVAVYGGVICISAVMYARSHIQDNIRKSEHFRQALKTLRTHSGMIFYAVFFFYYNISISTCLGAVQLLGEPIKENGFDLGDSRRNYCTSTAAQFEVKVSGPKDKGTMFFWANRQPVAEEPSVDAGWTINRLELEVKSMPDRRLVVKKEEENVNGKAVAQS